MAVMRLQFPVWHSAATQSAKQCAIVLNEWSILATTRTMAAWLGDWHSKVELENPDQPAGGWLARPAIGDTASKLATRRPFTIKGDGPGPPKLDLSISKFLKYGNLENAT